ncbi:hypothetical protein Tco_0414335 [Tanacetum coccineum]
MESNNMKSSCLDKDEQEIQRLCEIKKELQKKFDNIFHNFQICIHGLRPNWFYQSGEYAFQFLFREKFQSFMNIFDNNIDQLKKQLEKEELHECDSKTCLAVLKKQFDTFFDLKPSLSSSYQYQSELARQKEIFQEYAHYTYQSLKETILAYLDTIDKMIDERACHEEELRIIEKDVKNKQEKLEMEKQETMIQKSEYSSPGDNSDAKREKQEKKENCSKTFQELKMKEIDARAHHEYKLARVNDSRVNERTMQRQEGMVYMVKDKCDDGLVVKARMRDRIRMKDEVDLGIYTDLRKVDQDAEQCLENKTTESLNQTLVSENDCLKKTIAKLQQDFSKLEAQRIAFEIALQHKYQENNSLKTLQKENENFLASLQIENAHLKQTYKDLYELVQRSNVESNQYDEVKVKVNIDEIETNNIELEHRVSSLLKENEHLKLVYKNLFDSIKKTRVQKDNLRTTLTEFSVNHIFGKEDSSPSSTNELEKESGENICDNAKYFDDIKLELSNITAKFEAYFEKLEKTKVVLERQLARKVDDSKAEKDKFLKEINHLRTQLENLKRKYVKTKFDKSSILGEPPAGKLWIASQLSKSWFTPKIVKQKNLSKLVTTQSLPKNEKDQLLKRIAYLESKLASQDIRSCQKEYNELRTPYNA